MLDGEIVSEVARFKIVETVDEDIDSLCVSRDVAVVEVVDYRRYAYAGVDTCDSAPGSFGLGDEIRNVLLVEQHLPLKVCKFDEIAVHDHEVADAGTGKQVRSHAAQRTAPEYERRGSEEPALPLLPESGQERLTVVAREFAFAVCVTR